MAVFKSGDLVVLKSGGPVMTVDTVNTDIFDDDKITGVLCVWFVGEKFERVRFDHRAIEPANPQAALPEGERSELGVEATEDYREVLDNAVCAMNTSPDYPEAAKPAPRRQKRAAGSDIPKNTH
jgi:uncharacterized protein YodC (DUF2158 family)